MPVDDFGVIHKHGEKQPPPIHDRYCPTCSKAAKKYVETPHHAEKCLVCRRIWAKCDGCQRISDIEYFDIEWVWDNERKMWVRRFWMWCIECAYCAFCKKLGTGMLRMLKWEPQVDRWGYTKMVPKRVGVHKRCATRYFKWKDKHGNPGTPPFLDLTIKRPIPAQEQCPNPQCISMDFKFDVNKQAFICKKCGWKIKAHAYHTDDQYGVLKDSMSAVYAHARKLGI